MKHVGVPAAMLLLTLAACGRGSSQGAQATSQVLDKTPIAACSSPSKTGDLIKSLTVDGLKRTYLLHVPPRLPSHHRYPLVVMFHPMTGSGFSMEGMSGMSTVADTHDFLVAYPDGIDATWLSGGTDDEEQTRNDPRLHGKGTADVHFTQRLIEAVNSRVCIDPARIYAGGFSSGGSMVHRLACELAPWIAAIAPIEGTYTYGPCRPTQPVSVIAFHGTSDPMIPYHGGGQFHTPDVPTWAKAWAHRDHCARGPTPFLRQTFARAVRYTDCRSGAEVKLYAMVGGGHAWPYLGHGDASQIMWRFFAAHPRT